MKEQDNRTGMADINSILENALPPDVLKARFDQRFKKYSADDPAMRPVTVTWEDYEQIQNSRKRELQPPQISREDLLKTFKQSIIETAAGRPLVFDGNLATAYTDCFDHIISGSRKGIWICGDIGTGKSFLGKCLEEFTKKVSGDHGFQYSDVGHFYTADGIGDKDKPHLITGHRILDDIAAKTDLTQFGKWIEPLEAVLWERHRHFETAGKKTWFISNVTKEYYLEVLQENGLERLASRVDQIIEKQIIIKSSNKRNG